MTRHFNWDAVLFDMDGVLWDSMPIHQEAFASVLRDFDYRPHMGKSTTEVVRAAMPGATAARVREVVLAKQGIARELLKKRNPIRPGARELLAALKRNHLQRLLVTGASVDSMTLFLEMNDLASAFDGLVHEGMFARPKPAPDAYLTAADLLDLLPEQCLVVEDTVHGVRAGRLADCTVCGIVGTVAPSWLTKAGAVKVVADLEELGEWIGL